MESQYSRSTRYYRNHRTSYSNDPPPYNTSSPSPTSLRLEPAISRSPSREKRRSARISGPRSIPHNGTVCDNSMCDAPEIAAHDRLCSGPDGLQLCSRCYKRFKIERRRAREEQRAMTNDWMKPNRSRSKSNPPVEAPRASRRDSQYRSEILSSRDPASESIAKPSPAVTPSSPSEKTPSLHNFPTESMNDYDRHSRPPHRKQQSRREKSNEDNMHDDRKTTTPTHEDAEYYKHGRAESADRENRGCCCGLWHRKRRCMIIGSSVLSIIVLIVIIALAVTLTRKRNDFKYVPMTAQVNSTLAFESGGGTRDNVNDTSIGIGPGTDSYTYYKGNASNFPSKEKWVTFKDMWEKNLDTFKFSCGWLGYGKDNTPEMIQDIYNAIQDRANASLVDHRIILGTVLQETNGCPLNPPTTSSGGTRNPGLMQSHNGHEYDAKHSRLSILQMIQDGTQGTEHGWGLVDNLNTYGNPYKAMRGYNSGYIPSSGDLSEKAGATACYVSDIANRLTGWVRAKSTCPDDAH